MSTEKVMILVKGNDPCEIVRQARQANIDLIAITDHQSFNDYDPIVQEAQSAGRSLVVLPGIELTTLEGVHILAIFPPQYSKTKRDHIVGWFDIPGTGDTRIASRKTLSDILEKIDEDSGIVVAPHPFTSGIGILDGARKISTKVDWLESGHIRLIQLPEDRIKYLECDDEGNWLNRYVLASSRPKEIRSSTYCLAPFNPSDAHKPDQIPIGCSWFRMAEPTVEGLKQVACEPHTRIAREEPIDRNHDCILGLRVFGGYCDGQVFRFNDGLNCIVGQNHAGKSAVFDFIRFVLTHEDTLPKDSRDRLLIRLYGILKPEGRVELYLRKEGCHYVVRRSFNPNTSGEGSDLQIHGCYDQPTAYLLDLHQNELVPVEDFTFPIEVYEQGHIGRLREDISRQLDMLDEFANLSGLKETRAEIITRLNLSAEVLRPLYEERELLKSEVGNLPQLRQELHDKERYLPNQEEEQRWAKASSVVETINTIVSELSDSISRIPDPQDDLHERTTGVERIFGQKSPTIDPEEVAESDLLVQWINAVQTALDDIESARNTILASVRRLATSSDTLRNTWLEARRAHDRGVSEQLAKIGVESPREVIERVGELRRQINIIEKTKQPQLTRVNKQIGKEESARESLLHQLENIDHGIKTKRQEKVRDLTDNLEGKIKISLDPSADHTEYLRVLYEICDDIATRDSSIRSRESQLDRIVKKVTPLRLARALTQKGVVQDEEGSDSSLQALCGITENTQNVLCRIADNIQLLNKLQTITVPDVPKILVQRYGESTYADLRTGLSPGEQSAAILTLALETRTMPLIIDQPEGELGYNYVVHLIVPKTLRVKSSRQLLVITHDANIPVLGDADYVIKMENRPLPDTGRECVVAEEGCFESSTITDVLIELEGGQRAFQFRQHRYALPRKVP